MKTTINKHSKKDQEHLINHNVQHNKQQQTKQSTRATKQSTTETQQSTITTKHKDLIQLKCYSISEIYETSPHILFQWMLCVIANCCKLSFVVVVFLTRLSKTWFGLHCCNGSLSSLSYELHQNKNINSPRQHFSPCPHGDTI